MGRDQTCPFRVDSNGQFQSTLPAWGETSAEAVDLSDEPISIHSPRMGRDGARRGGGQPHRNFNPLSPHGERPPAKTPRPEPKDFNPLSPHGERRSTSILFYNFLHFNPLSPHGERPRRKDGSRMKYAISIHSPRMGRDSLSSWRPVRPTNFNPLSPHGERHL